MNETFLLTAAIVPTPLWYQNLRKLLPRAEWDRIRKSIYAEYYYRCGICKARGLLHCHEIWEYDDWNHVQKLKGLIALCVDCHNVKHLIRSRTMADANQLDYEKLIQHFMRVNQCSREAFEEYQAFVFAEFQERSEFEWTVDFGAYQKFA